MWSLIKVTVVSISVSLLYAGLVLSICLGMMALAGCQTPKSPPHSYVIDRTGYYNYEDQERIKKNVAKFFEMFAKNPTGMKHWMLESKYPKCRVAGCAGRIFDGVCDVCGRERK